MQDQSFSNKYAESERNVIKETKYLRGYCSVQQSASFTEDVLQKCMDGWMNGWIDGIVGRAWDVQKNIFPLWLNNS